MATQTLRQANAEQQAKSEQDRAALGQLTARVGQLEGRVARLEAGPPPPAKAEK